MAARLKTKEEFILTAALNAFMERGFASTNIQTIATNAGIAKGTIYEYYETKEELFIQSIKYRFNEGNLKIIQEVSQKQGFFEKLECVLDKIICGEEKGFYKWIDSFLFNDFGNLDQVLRIRFKDCSDTMRERVISVYRQIIIEGIKEKKIIVHDLEFASTCLFSLVTAYNSYIPEQDYDQRVLEKTRLLDMILNGLRYRE